MWNSLGHLGIPASELVIRAVVVYFAILLLLRAGGKKQLGQMGASEFVAILLISNAVQNSMNGGDNSLLGGLILAGVLIALTWLVDLATYRSRRVRHLLEGRPTLLIHRGEVLDRNLAAERITKDQLKVLLRKQGLHSFGDVHAAILESDGTLSLTKKSEVTPAL